MGGGNSVGKQLRLFMVADGAFGGGTHGNVDMLTLSSSGGSKSAGLDPASRSEGRKVCARAPVRLSSVARDKGSGSTDGRCH